MKIYKNSNVKAAADFSGYDGEFADLAAVVGESILRMAQSDGSLENFVSYLSHHFDAWLKQYAYDPETFAYELQHFSKIYR